VLLGVTAEDRARDEFRLIDPREMARIRDDDDPAKVA
jgi:hypothetical protein